MTCHLIIIRIKRNNLLKITMCFVLFRSSNLLISTPPPPTILLKFSSKSATERHYRIAHIIFSLIVLIDLMNILIKIIILNKYKYLIYLIIIYSPKVSIENQVIPRVGTIFIFILIYSIVV